MILVTGAAGQNGAAVIREFARHRIPVRVLVRDRRRTQAIDGLPRVELVEGDMARASTLTAALDGVERALMISSANARLAETQCAFIDACRAAGVRHVVKFSGAESSIGYDPREFRFTRMHEDVERYLEGSGLAWTHLRPSQFMQVYLREAPTIAHQWRDVSAISRHQVVSNRRRGHRGNHFCRAARRWPCGQELRHDRA